MGGMKRILIAICVLIVGMRGVFAEAPASAPATQSDVRIELSSPREWQMFQRRNATEGSIHVEGKIVGRSDAQVDLDIGPEESDLQELPTDRGDHSDVGIVQLHTRRTIVRITIGKQGDFAFDLPAHAGEWR